MELSRTMVEDLCRYSSSEPQILPFPPELVVRTLSYLDQACDKKNARLVCKGFAAAGLSSLTSTVYFSTSLIKIDYRSKNPHCSSPTRELALHPIISKYITRLICDSTQLPIAHLQLQAFQNWWATLGRKSTSWPVEKIHGLYSSRYKQEKWIIDRGEDRKIFCTALEQFVHLKCVVFTDVAANELGGKWPRPTWPFAIPDGNLWAPSSPYHSFVMGIRSLSEMDIKLHELSIKGRQNGISNAIFSRASPKDYNHLLNVFANLRKISLHINTHGDTHPLLFAGLGRLLIHATLLQSLDLSCLGGQRQARLILSRVFQNATWPHLKHFGLHGFVVHSDAELIAFFDRHRATIDSVALKSMFLHDKDINSPDPSFCQAWKHFFGELRKRAIEFQKLDLYRIQDCYNSAAGLPDLAAREKKVLQYLRHGGPNPFASDVIS